MSHPYKGLPAQNFWSRSVAGVPPFDIDPVSPPPFQLAPETRVATAGSCFAQHIARELKKSGFNYHVAERGDGLTPDEAHKRNFGLFSARYGNIYTTRQLLQLIQRAFGLKNFDVPTWLHNDRVVDPFRPTTEPEGFATEAAMKADAVLHLAAVKQMFETLDVFVFTLGLTEGWIHRTSGAVLPLAPGISGGEWDAAEYEFKNFRVTEVMEDLNESIRLIKAVNPSAKFILTVSPVPLAATYESRHVLVSTVESKSILRVAAAEAVLAFQDVAYFPSFELITLPVLGARYYEEDLRNVQPHGVKHVMRVFFAKYTNRDGAGKAVDAPPEYDAGLRHVSSVVCDEELIERAA